MKVIDVNLLLYAVNGDAPEHEAAREWLDQALSSEEQVGLPWIVVIGFLRISTRAGIFAKPLAVADAIAIVDGWFAQSTAVLLHPGSRHWDTLRSLLSHAGTAGNLTTDAHLAALAIEYRATLCTTDRDFSRFGSRLRFLNPLKS